MNKGRKTELPTFLRVRVLKMLYMGAAESRACGQTTVPVQLSRNRKWSTGWQCRQAETRQASPGWKSEWRMDRRKQAKLAVT